MPEMFLKEIGQLTEDERRKYKTRRVEYSSLDGILTRSDEIENALLNDIKTQDKIMEMKLYLFFQEQDFYSRYNPFLLQVISNFISFLYIYLG